MLLQGHKSVLVPETRCLSPTMFLFHYRKCNLFIKTVDERLNYKSELEKSLPALRGDWSVAED